MKIKIIKKYEWPERAGRFWDPKQIVDVDNDKGRRLIKEGFAHEIRIEKRKDSKGIEFEVQVEVIDKSASIITDVKKVKK